MCKYPKLYALYFVVFQYSLVAPFQHFSRRLLQPRFLSHQRQFARKKSAAVEIINTPEVILDEKNDDDADDSGDFAVGYDPDANFLISPPTGKRNKGIELTEEVFDDANTESSYSRLEYDDDDLLSEWENEYDDADRSPESWLNSKKTAFPFKYMEGDLDPSEITPLTAKDTLAAEIIYEGQEVNVSWPEIEVADLQNAYNADRADAAGDLPIDRKTFYETAMWKFIEKQYPVEQYPVLSLTSDEPPEEIYVTRSELVKLWSDSKLGAGKSKSKFSIEESLLLLEVQTSRMEFPPDDTSLEPFKRRKSIRLVPEDDIIYVSQQELEQLWKQREGLKWALPAEKFDLKESLLLLEEDISSGVNREIFLPGWDHPSEEVFSPENEDDEMIDCLYPGEEHRHTRTFVKQMFSLIENKTEFELNWRKRYDKAGEPESHYAIFGADMYMSMSRGYNRIKNVNWDNPETNPELDFLNYVTLPNINITDFTKIEKNVSKILNISLTPTERDYFEGIYKKIREKYDTEEIITRYNENDPTLLEFDKKQAYHEPLEKNDAHDEIDWSTFDFSTFDLAQSNNTSALSKSNVEGVPTVMEDQKLFGDIDIDKNPLYAKLLRRIRGVFGAENDAIVKESALVSTSPDIVSKGPIRNSRYVTADLIPDIDGSGRSLPDIPMEERIDLQKYYINHSDPRHENEPRYCGPDPGDNVDIFAVPSPEEISRRFRGYVGYNIWGKYGDEDYDDRDNSVWEDDIISQRTAETLMNATDLYLCDHLKVMKDVEESKYYSKYLHCSLSGNWSTFNDSLPQFLTPDKHHGIKYTDEIIEMKGKKSLLPEYEDNSIAYANDTFTYNTDIEATCEIGTVRDQYDWRPRGDKSEWDIDSTVVKKIKPLLDFIGDVAILRSTKNNTLVFEYMGGILRQVTGMRAMMLSMAKDILPDLVDLRLEADSGADQFDTNRYGG